MPDMYSYRICQSAIDLFKERGFEEVSMLEIAERAEVTEAELYALFGQKNDIVLFLFQQINSEWLARVENLPETKLTERFEECLRIKLELVEPYADFLGQILGLLIQHSKIGVKAPRTSHIRSIGMQAMQCVIHEAANGAKLERKIPQLPAVLYLMHWIVLFTRLQTDKQEHIEELTKLLASTLKYPKKLEVLKMLFPFMDKLSVLTEKLIDIPQDGNEAIDREILKVVFNNRKALAMEKACASNQCETCFALHTESIRYFTRQSKPIQFILPAFPAKSPNRLKTLGDLPDLGEEIALLTLEAMCEEIASIYPPGAHITICSDGRIFSQLVGVTDENITHYVQHLAELIEAKGISHVRIVNLEHLTTGKNFEEMRNTLLSTYAEDFESLKAQTKQNKDLQALFNGIHRFITEDRLAMDSGKSKTQIKEESKKIALQVIQHSNAWTRFLANVFSEAIRLSIHPYPVHSRKIGIRLTRAEDNWLTPWHGTITLQENGYVLMKRSQAEEMGATLVEKEGQPYYYSLIRKP